MRVQLASTSNQPTRSPPSTPRPTAPAKGDEHPARRARVISVSARKPPLRLSCPSGWRGAARASAVGGRAASGVRTLRIESCHEGILELPLSVEFTQALDVALGNPSLDHLRMQVSSQVKSSQIESSPSQDEINLSQVKIKSGQAKSNRVKCVPSLAPCVQPHQSSHINHRATSI